MQEYFFWWGHRDLPIMFPSLSERSVGSMSNNSPNFNKNRRQQRQKKSKSQQQNIQKSPFYTPNSNRKNKNNPLSRQMLFQQQIQRDQQPISRRRTMKVIFY